MIENQRLDFDALALCSKAQRVKAQSCHGPGIYAHVLYDRARNVIGIYVGSAYSISKRARDHINNYKAAMVQQQPETRRRRKVKVQLNQHYRFWKSPGVEDFWLVVNQFDPPRSFGKRRDQDYGSCGLFCRSPQLYGALCSSSFPNITPRNSASISAEKVRHQSLSMGWTEFRQSDHPIPLCTGRICACLESSAPTFTNVGDRVQTSRQI